MFMIIIMIAAACWHLAGYMPMWCAFISKCVGRNRNMKMWPYS